MSQIILDNYSKQYNIEVIKNDKQIIIRSKLESDTCMYLIKNLDRTSIDKAYINNNEFSIELEKALLKNSKEQTRSDLDNIRKSICNNPSKNTIDFIINK